MSAGERIRVQKAIAHAGLMSRRAAEEAVSDRRVTINGEVAILGDRVDVTVDRVEVDGVLVPVDPALETHLLYKPRGVISTASDPQGRRTVVDLVDSTTRLYPVGRLDADSEGLILLTNDGDLANQVTHPRYGITKQYLVRVSGTMSESLVRRLVDGVELEDGPAHAIRARIVGRSGNETMIEMIMAEGRKREIRRMIESLGATVTRLVRVAIGPLGDRSLQPGQSRRVTASEINRLLATARQE